MNRQDILHHATMVLDGQQVVFPNSDSLDFSNDYVGRMLAGEIDSQYVRSLNELDEEFNSNQAMSGIVTCVCYNLQQQYTSFQGLSGKNRARKVQFFHVRTERALRWMLDNAPLWATIGMVRLLLAIFRVKFNHKRIPSWNEFADRSQPFF